MDKDGIRSMVAGIDIGTISRVALEELGVQESIHHQGMEQD